MKLFLVLILLSVALAGKFRHQAYEDPDRLFALSVSLSPTLSPESSLESPTFEHSEAFRSSSVPIQMLHGPNRLSKPSTRFLDVSFEESLTPPPIPTHGPMINPKLTPRLDFLSQKKAMKTLEEIVGDIETRN